MTPPTSTKGITVRLLVLILFLLCGVLLVALNHEDAGEPLIVFSLGLATGGTVELVAANGNGNGTPPAPGEPTSST